ncbi:MAG: DUF4382 domain-containing protein [Nitrospirae bacterium]|nr:DUF4382 domain-containing protein [Nitrospirota bacterium]
MSYLRKSEVKLGIVVGVLFLLSILLYACGGGSSSGTSAASLYITDDLSTNYSQVYVTIYKIQLEKASDQSLVTVFEDPAGVTYDMTELRGVLEKIGSIPPGTYTKIIITVDQQLILVEKVTGNQITADLSENAWTSCSNGQCDYEIVGAINVIEGQKVIVDFDLKQFVYDPVTNTVTAKIVVDADGSEHSGYYELKSDKYKLKGIIVSIDTANNTFVVQIIKAKHFVPTEPTITVTTTDTTVFTCDDDDDNYLNCNVSSFGDLATGMKVEIYGSYNSSTGNFDATKVAVDNDDDIYYSSCSEPARSILDYTGLSYKTEVEASGADPYTYNPDDHSITVSGSTYLITKETILKDETSKPERVICVDSMPVAATKIEVKYVQARDADGNTVNIAIKVEFKNSSSS